MTLELEHYLQFLQDHLRQLDELIQDLSLEAVNWVPLADGTDHATNSIAVLVAHVTGSEQFWVGELLGGLTINRERDTEFQAVAADIASLRDRIQETDDMMRQVLTSVDPARLDETVQIREHTLTLRWGVIHMIEHAAMHLGHIQLTRQLWESQQGSA